MFYAFACLTFYPPNQSRFPKFSVLHYDGDNAKSVYIWELVSFDTKESGHMETFKNERKKITGFKLPL